MSATSFASANSESSTYDLTAPFYDALTAHHDYELWIGNLLPELERLGLIQGRLLDIACGTGKSFLPMLRRRWKVDGVDASARMLERAQEKVGPDTALHMVDMRALPDLGQFELVWCLDDAINCLRSVEDLVLAFRSAGQHLSPGGLYVFDANTLLTYRGFFSGSESIELDGGVRLEWVGRTSRSCLDGCLARADFRAIAADGSLLAQTEHHQRHFPIDSLTRALRRAGLEVVSLTGHDHSAELQPLDEKRHTKAIFVSRLTEGR